MLEHNVSLTVIVRLELWHDIFVTLNIIHNAIIFICAFQWIAKATYLKNIHKDRSRKVFIYAQYMQWIDRTN